jgi:hypothetical protein
MIQVRRKLDTGTMKEFSMMSHHIDFAKLSLLTLACIYRYKSTIHIFSVLFTPTKSMSDPHHY